MSLGKSAGADLVEVFLEKSDNISLLAEQDDISNVSPSFGIGAGIRVFLGRKDGFVSTMTGGEVLREQFGGKKGRDLLKVLLRQTRSRKQSPGP